MEKEELNSYLEKRDMTLERLHASAQRIADTEEGAIFLDWFFHITGVTAMHPVRDADDRLRKEGKRQIGFAVAEFLALDELQIRERIIQRIQDAERRRQDNVQIQSR
jgi:hypothetical protein